MVLVRHLSPPGTNLPRNPNERRPMSCKFLRLGVDVGGTNTDAVLLDANASTAEGAVMKWAKVPTTSELSSVEKAITKVLKNDEELTSQVRCVTIGTTYFLNALVERDALKLQKVGVLRLASCGFTKNTPPFVDFPPELRNVILGHIGFIEGGLNVDGTVIGKPEKADVVRECITLRQKGIRNVVVVGTFSPVDVEYRQEEVVRDWVLEELGEINVVCSAEVGRLGILERENAAILNASMLNMSSIFSKGLQDALSAAGLNDKPLFVSSNHGTMISIEEATKKPVSIIASGPSNSLIGALALIHPTGAGTAASQIEAMIVIDIGGSTSDAGMILNTGYPRQGSAYSEIADVRVNFPMPDVQSIGLGGGSIIETKNVKGSLVAVQVGPQSVGADLKKALCFGGNTITASDIAIAAGDMPNFGTTPVHLEKSLITSAKLLMQRELEKLVDSIKTKATPLPVALVGGAAALCQSPLKGTSDVLHHKLAGIANAIGAGRAKLSTIVDVILDVDNGRSSKEDERILKNIISQATDECVSKGAQRDTVKVIFQELVALPYVANKVRVYVQVVGQLDTSKTASRPKPIKPQPVVPTSHASLPSSSRLSQDFTVVDTTIHTQPSCINLKDLHSINAYRPKIINNEWHISPTDLEFLQIGTYILGCGGGGSPYLIFLEARECLRNGEILRINDVSSLPKDGLLMPVVCLGSPMIGVERPGGNLSQDALSGMLKHVQRESFAAIVCVEIGGANGMMNLIAGSSASHNVPIIDGDLMGRAFPSFEKITPYVFSTGDINELLPVSLSSGDGTDFIMTSAKNLEMVDRTLRRLLVEMGCAAGMAQRPMSVSDMEKMGVLRSHSLAWRLGRAVKRCQASQNIEGVGEALVREFGGEGVARIIFEGKIISTENRIVNGQSYGEIRIKGAQVAKPEQPMSASADEVLRIVFNNENLIAEIQSDSGKAKVIASVPNLIIILDARTGTALGVPEYRFGLKVIVLAAAPSPIWTSKRGLEVAGPKAFGFHDVEFESIGKYCKTKSVIKEFS